MANDEYVDATPYVVTVVQPRRSRWERLKRRPAILFAWPVCPVCAERVERTEAVVREGAEGHDGEVTWKSPDEYVGVRLQPCGHRVAGQIIIAGELRARGAR